MLTDLPPLRHPLSAEFLRSDRLRILEVPHDARLREPAKSIALAIESGQSAPVRQACTEFLTAAAEFYQVRPPQVRVLAARPIHGRETGWASELFGDYDPKTALIRVWMRTAVRKQVTSFGTFLSTLCHEFCHHLDCERLGFRDTPHTRGFYERVAVLYHHARGTPPKRLFWVPLRGGRWRVDWSRMNRTGEE